jgi:enoyl-CoA hydratase/carnithine racemase
MGEFVRLEVAEGIGTIRLDRPPVNALSDQVRDELAEAARAAQASDEIRAVILYGGEKVFAAGADIKEMADADYAAMATRSGRLQATLSLIAGLPKPVVAAITGYALGGGLELALAADFRVAGQTARLGQPEILLGVIPGAGGTQRLPRLVGPARAKDIVFTGRMVPAAEAHAIGLVDLVAPDAEVYQAALHMVRRYASGPALALRAAKQAIDHGLDADLGTGLEIERIQFAALFGTQDQKAGMRSFMENGPGKATFTGRLGHRGSAARDQPAQGLGGLGVLLGVGHQRGGQRRRPLTDGHGLPGQHHAAHRAADLRDRPAVADRKRHLLVAELHRDLGDLTGTPAHPVGHGPLPVHGHAVAGQRLAQ